MRAWSAGNGGLLEQAGGKRPGSLTDDGFFRTGDIAVIQQDGQVRIVDRIKDMVLVSGFNVYPNESRGCAGGPSEIVEAAVIGVPDEHSGEAVCSLHRAQGREPDARGSAGILPREPHRLQDSATRWNSAIPCPRPMSARCCAGACARRFSAKG